MARTTLQTDQPRTQTQTNAGTATAELSRSARNRVNEFERKRQELQEYIADNYEVFGPFLELSDEYNKLHEAAKDALRRHPGGSALSYKSFRRNRAPDKGHYDPTKLPGIVLTIPGIVKSVDKEKLNQLAIEEPLHAKDIRAAWQDKSGTPSVTGPKKVVVELG